MLESGCDNEITDAPGMVMSPFYPNNYPNNVECSNHIMAPMGETVIVQFRDFTLEPDINNCQQNLDTLSIYDGSTPSEENLVGVYCGNTIPERFQSTGRSMLLVFKTDGQGTYTGFEAAYYFIPPTQEPVTEPLTPPMNQPNCGKQQVPLMPETNIVGGKEAQQGEYPWQAAIYANNDFICGGSVLHSRWIATTASCLQDTASKTLTVRVATNSRVDHPSRVQTGTVDFSYFHPEFDPETKNFDIVLLKMEADFSLNDYVQTICVPSAGMDSRFDTGTTCMATGWGARFDGGPLVDNLHEVELDVEDQAYCRQHYPETVTDNMLCAGPMEGGKGVCDGDEGGPLAARIGGLWFLVGMSSWDRGCAIEFFPSVFTRVSAVSAWIEPIFNGGEPDISPPTEDPLKGIEDELEKVNDQSDLYMKIMFGLVGGIVLALLVLIYIAFSYNDTNARLKDKLLYMQSDEGQAVGAGGIGIALPATSTNVYEMNAPEGGVDNAGAEIEESKADDDDNTGATAVTTASLVDDGDKKQAPAVAKKPSVKKQDMGTDNPEFIKYPKE
ncbi:ovochymase-2-like [Amphiura filiformis]|uniref:ovochymase-2-like n=1 Tax=Amphiura filiformis TaxID=82378 RepID=UPI003B20E578